MKESKSSVCAEGAICVAITVIILLIGIFVPFLHFISLAAGGVPLACLICRRGIAAGGIALVAVFLLSLIMISNPLSALFLVVLCVFPGMAAGFCISRKFSFGRSLTVVCLIVAAGVMLEMFLGGAIAGIESFEETLKGSSETVKAIFTEAFSQYANDAAVKELIPQIDVLIEQTVYTIRYYLPTILIAFSAVLGYAVFAFNAFIVKRVCRVNNNFLPLGSLKAPKSMIYVAIAAYFIGLFSKNGGNFAAVVDNFSAVLYMAIAVCGFSFLENKLSGKISSGAARAALYFAAMFIVTPLLPIVFYVFVTIGMFDAVFNFRHLGKEKDKDE